ncbi:Ku protein [Halomonas chromatireducens]|uniref:Non-homologous end joining protein Ku n=1 Tax=Halomonas chromatireducens TaxID=507626 RepID=A0A0X8HBV8_9GAMM|nr:Ku protein [Halomonas chromatireducens]AMC99739.1 putative DNA repair protein YkoV [Halomonas chromatireducens]
MPSQSKPQTKGKEKEKDKRKDPSAKRDEKKRFHASGPRPLWSGTITFGLVSLPVNLYPANRPKTVSLRMVDSEGTPLARRYFCELEQRVLDYDELVRGYEVEKNEFVVVEDRELESLAPEKSQEIDLKRFVGLDEIDPMYFQRAYFMTPDKGVTKAYRLLAESMEATGRAGIATFVMRGKEYLVAIIAEKGILRAETLRFAEEVRAPEDIGLPAPTKPDKQRVKAMQKAIEALAEDDFERDELQDLQSQRIVARAEEKLSRGKDVITLGEEESEPDVEPEQGGEVIDLMQVLKQSLAEGRPPGGQESDSDTSSRQGQKAEKRKQASKRDTTRKTAARDKSPTTELENLSRDELYARAQQHDVPGRSRMSKAELLKAIVAAG